MGQEGRKWLGRKCETVGASRERVSMLIVTQIITKAQCNAQPLVMIIVTTLKAPPCSHETDWNSSEVGEKLPVTSAFKYGKSSETKSKILIRRNLWKPAT